VRMLCCSVSENHQYLAFEYRVAGIWMALA
jgi:hypothetical protein